MRRRWLLLSAAAAAALAGLSALSVTRIPEGYVGVREGCWLAAGWHLRPPLSRLTRLPSTDWVEIDDVQVTSPAGAASRLTVRLHYRIDTGADPALASSIRREGFTAALASALGGRWGEAARDSSTRAGRRSGSIQDPIGASLAARLRERGIEPLDLVWERADTDLLPAPIPSGEPSKVLLVGLDGADWEIADRLLAAGRLPTLARLIRGGARASLRSYDPMMSPLIWTTIVTGMGPAEHGVADFLVTDNRTGQAIPITSRFRKVKALWNILSDSQISSGFAGWWATYPAEPVNGILVSDLLAFSMSRPEDKGAEGITWPESYLAEIRPRLVTPDAATYADVIRMLRVSPSEFEQAKDIKAPDPAPGREPTAQDPIWHVRKIIAATRNYETIALDLLRRGVDVVGVYFEGIDLMGHRFQHCLPPRMTICSPGDYEKYRDAVTSFYEYQDEVLGRVVEAARGRTVLVVSDHGFRSGADRPHDFLPYTTGQPVEWHREHGILVITGPKVRRSTVLARASVYDIAPTILYLVGLPAAEDMMGRILEEAIEPSWLAAYPPRRIPSYEDVGRARVLPTAAASPQAQQEMVETLQALGYVGPLPAVPASTSEAEVGKLGDSASDAGVPDESTRVTYHRNLATHFLKTGRVPEAEAQLLRANEIQPLPKTYEMLSEIQAMRGDKEGAIRFLEEALGRFPELEEEAILWIVDLRLQQGRPELARAAFDRWQARIERPAVRYACEGKLMAARGESERAISFYLDALRHEPTLSQAAVSAAPLLDAQGRLAELEPALRKALATERRIDEYQNLLGLIRLRAGRPSEAMEAIGLALDIDAANARFLENYAAAALAAGKPAKALERYRLGLQSPLASGVAWAGFGRLLGRTQRPEDAASAFEKAIDLGETSAATYAGHVAALLQSGQKARSIASLREGLGRHPSDPTLRALERQLL